MWQIYYRILISAGKTFGLGLIFWRWLLFLPLFLGFTHFTLFLDKIFFSQYQKVQVKNPVFIIGNPRSGTSFLHSLLTQTDVLFEIELSKTCLTHGFSPNYVFYQPDLETQLRQGVNRFDCVTIHLAHTVEGIVQERDGVILTVRDLSVAKVRSDQASPGAERDRTTDNIYQVQARYVLGCDGARSVTRQLAGIKLHDFGFHQRQLVVDTLLTEEFWVKECVLGFEMLKISVGN